MKGGYFVKVYEIIYVQIEEHYVCIWEAIRKIKISVSLLYSNDWTMSYEKYSVYYAIDVARENALNFSKKLHALDGKPPGQFRLHLHDEF